MRLLGRASLKWPVTEGTLLSVKAEPMSVVSPAVQAVGTTATVRYSYYVDGTEYIGDRLDFTGQFAGGSWQASRALQRYTPGQSVVVHFDPKSPQRSVLNPGSDIRTGFRFAVGAIFIGIGFVGLFM